MSGEFFAFYAQVPEAGFEIIQYRDPDSASETQWIVSKDGHVEEGSADVPVQRYRPLEDHTALFRTFAETIATEQGILEFANKYGLLNARHIPPPNFGEAGVTHAGLVSGEPLEIWSTEIEAMRKSVVLWDAVRSRDEAKLRQIWKKEKGFYDLLRGTIQPDQTSIPAANFVLDAITSGKIVQVSPKPRDFEITSIPGTIRLMYS